MSQTGTLDPFQGQGYDEAYVSLFHLYKYFLPFISGDSVNAAPHDHKLCSPGSHSWGTCRGQHVPSAGPEPQENHLPDHGIAPAR